MSRTTPTVALGGIQAANFSDQLQNFKIKQMISRGAEAGAVRTTSTVLGVKSSKSIGSESAKVTEGTKMRSNLETNASGSNLGQRPHMGFQHSIGS